MKNIFIFIFAVIFLFVSFTKVMSAEVINILNFPSSKIAGEEFEVNFEGLGLSPSSTYYMKGLGGDIGSSLTEIDTWNGGWNQQNGSWSSMSTFTSNNEGSASATIKLRFDPNVMTNNKELKVRIRKTDNDNNIDSGSVNISVTAATPAPTLAPTQSPTPAPTKSPTSTPKPISTKTPTSRPTSTPEENEEKPEFNISDSNAAFTQLSDVTPEPEVAGASTISKKPLLAIIFISGGLICLGYGGYLIYTNKHVKSIN